jgi:hypothetical protein
MMSGLASIGLTVLGGFLATVGGIVIAGRQHRYERRMTERREKRDALLELADALHPLLLEIDRWAGPKAGDWVGASRSLPELGTWVLDDETNAQKVLDWPAIAESAHVVERLWWGRLQTRIHDQTLRNAYGKMSKAAFQLSRRDVADKRATAQHLLKCASELRNAIDWALAAADAGRTADGGDRP